MAIAALRVACNPYEARHLTAPIAGYEVVIHLGAGLRGPSQRHTPLVPGWRRFPRFKKRAERGGEHSQL